MREFVRAIVWLGVIAGAIGFLLHLFVFDTWRVPVGAGTFAVSVQPQLAVDDLLVLRRSGRPKYGELARCISPVDGAFVVGRVFGEAGDHVEVSDDVPTTNGKAASSRHACPQVTLPHPVTQNLVKLSCGVVETGAWSYQYLASAEHVPTGHSSADVGPDKLYLVSDNRLMHQDSRDFGLVDADRCQHVVYRLWGERYADDSRRFTVLW